MKAKKRLKDILCLVINLINQKRISTLVLLFVYLGSQNTVAQTPKLRLIDDLPELKVGDTVPEELWNHPMELWTAADGSTQTITLNDYRGKVIILDFWATWCGDCIASFPYMHNLQRKGGKDVVVLPITSQNNNEIYSFFSKSTAEPYLEVKDDFYSIVGQELRNIFPLIGIPHIIVINRRGEVQGITLPQYLNDGGIAQLINNEKEVYIPFKRSSLEDPRLTFSAAYDDVKTYGPAFYSSVIKFTDGVGYGSGWYPDSINGITRFVVSNSDINTLYTRTEQFSSFPFQHNRTILEVIDLDNYIRPAYLSKRLDFMRENYYSYEAVLPIYLSREEAGGKMKSDLDLFLGLNTKLEKRKVKCFVIKELRDYVIPDSLINARRDRTQSLATSLNQSHFLLPLVIDEADDLECIWPTSFPRTNVHHDINDLRAWIRPYGLDLVPEVRELEMFVLTEKGQNSIPMDQLELTKYGYVPKNK